MPGNVFVWRMLAEMDPGLFDSGLALNVDLIRYTFDLWEVERDRQFALFSKVMVYVGVTKDYVRREQKKEREKNRRR